jgi:hypothetical protein
MAHILSGDMLGGSWSRSIEEAGQLLGRGRGRGAGRSPISGGVALSRWRRGLLLGVAIANILPTLSARQALACQSSSTRIQRERSATASAIAVACRSVGVLPKAAR